MHRIFIHNRQISDSVIQLDNKTAHHLITVCRLKPKSKLEIVINKTKLLLVKIKHIDLNQLHVHILDQWALNASRKIPIQLIQSLPKQDKLTEICRICTEIGVQIFHPVITDFCDVKELSDNKYNRAVMAIESAAKQSKQSSLPKLTDAKPIIDFFDGLQYSSNSLKLVAYENTRDRLSTIVKKIPDEIIIAIGPEGGFSQSDIDLFIENDFMPFSLGDHILRTEHAGFASICYLDGYLDSH